MKVLGFFENKFTNLEIKAKWVPGLPKLECIGFPSKNKKSLEEKWKLWARMRLGKIPKRKLLIECKGSEKNISFYHGIEWACYLVAFEKDMENSVLPIGDIDLDGNIYLDASIENFLSPQKFLYDYPKGKNLLTAQLVDQKIKAIDSLQKISILFFLHESEKILRTKLLAYYSYRYQKPIPVITTAKDLRYVKESPILFLSYIDLWSEKEKKDLFYFSQDVDVKCLLATSRTCECGKTKCPISKWQCKNPLKEDSMKLWNYLVVAKDFRMEDLSLLESSPNIFSPARESFVFRFNKMDFIR